MRKEAYVRNYIISTWLTLFFIAILMTSNNPPDIFLWIARAGFMAFALIVLIHSKRHNLMKIMIWELIGISFALVLAVILSSSATEGIASTFRWVLSSILTLSSIGAFVYMLAYGKTSRTL